DEKVDPLLEKIVAIKDPSAAMSLMHYSGIADNMVFIQRTTPTHLITDALSHYSDLLRTALAAISCEDLTETMWRLAGLPWKKDECHLRHPTLHAPAAHLDSLLACREQVLTTWLPAQTYLERMISEAVALFNSNISSAVTSVKIDTKMAIKQGQLSEK